jgi:hypothetical protein
MRIVRSFQGDNPPVDTYTLSNLGRFDQDDASQFTDVARQLPAMQMSVGTGLAKDSVVIRDNIDAANPITHFFYVPPEHFRYHTVRVRCDFFSFRGTANTAYSDPNLPLNLIADVSVDHGTHDLTASGTANSASVTNLDDHYHRITVPAQSGATANVHVTISGGEAVLSATSGGTTPAANIYTFKNESFDTTHTHPVSIPKTAVALQHPANLTGKLPSHNHLIEQRIPQGQQSPASITLSINGMALPSGAQTSGTRDSTNAFTSSFVADIAPYLEGIAPGTDVPLVFSAGTSGSNLSGVGYLVVTITSVEELGGLTSKVTPA